MHLDTKTTSPGHEECHFALSRATELGERPLLLADPALPPDIAEHPLPSQPLSPGPYALERSAALLQPLPGPALQLVALGLKPEDVQASALHELRPKQLKNPKVFFVMSIDAAVGVVPHKCFWGADVRSCFTQVLKGRAARLPQLFAKQKSFPRAVSPSLKALATCRHRHCLDSSSSGCSGPSRNPNSSSRASLSWRSRTSKAGSSCQSG